MATRSIHKIIEDELNGTHAAAWATALTQSAAESVGRNACGMIDFTTAAVSSDWTKLDDPHYRMQVAEKDPLLILRCTELLDSVIDSLRAAIEAENYGRQTVAWMRRTLPLILTHMMPKPAVPALLLSSPFSENWSFLGNAIARHLHGILGNTLPDQRENEWLIMNHLILAEYFRQCALPEARLVAIELGDARRGLLSVRGSLVCTTNQISAAGIGVDRLRTTAFRGGIHLHHEPLSSLLTTVARESQQVAAGHGLMRRISAHHVDAPTEVSGGQQISPAMLQAARTRSYPRYEHSINAYMGMAAIEQLARSCAQQNSIRHLRAGNIPAPVENWVGRLPCDPAVIATVRGLFSSDESNLRNRMMHSGFLLTEGGSLLENLAIADPTRYGPVAARPRAHTPANVAHLVLECLHALDADIHRRQPLSQADFAWSQNWLLTPSELQTGRQVYCDLIPRPNGPTEADARAWLVHLSRYFSAIMPGLGQFFRTAYHGFMNPFSEDSLPSLHALGMVFEAIYRLTAHLIGLRILGNTTSGASSYFQYFMLDEAGLHNSYYVDRLIEYLEPHEHVVAREILGLAVKARNALAHGSVVHYDEQTHLGMTHLLLKSTQLLVGAGEYHMTKECAWHRWHNLHPDDHGRHDEDWFAAEEHILRTIDILGNPRTNSST